MMTSNDKHRWVFPLVPTACAYAKLGEYFGKLRKAEIDVMQMQGGFGEHSEVGKVATSKNQQIMSEMENPKAIVSDMKETIQNTFVKRAGALSGCEGTKNEMGN